MVAVEVAVLAEDGRSVQLDVLCVNAADQSLTILDVVEQTLGHEWVLVQVHQVGRLHHTHATGSTLVTAADDAADHATDSRTILPLINTHFVGLFIV